MGDKDESLPENMGTGKIEVIERVPIKQRNDPDIKKLNMLQGVIQSGMANPLSGTGTPVADLTGAAKENAQRANIGGGSKANGGGGMMQGTKNLMEAAYVKGKIDERYKEGDMKKIEK